MQQLNKLNHLCFILPADLDEIERWGCDKKEDQHLKPHHKESKTKILVFIGNLIERVYDRIWIGFCQCYPKKKNNNNEHSGNFQDMAGVVLYEKQCSNNPRIFSYTELYIGSNGFSKDELLGSGAFGRVYRALLPSDGTLVAVKCVAEGGGPFEKTFVAELMAVAQLRHRNLVRLRGWCIHEQQLLLVYDYMPNRSLDQILFRRSGTEILNWDRRLRIVSGLAAALFYLHEQLETQIIHRDIKTSNVMLDSNYNARLGDFGLARWLEHQLQFSTQLTTTSPPPTKKTRFRLVETTTIGGTFGYLPPETFHKHSMATAKSDVFSFGIVALEVASGRRAVDLTYIDDQIILLDWVRKLSDDGKHLQAADPRLPQGSYRLSEMKSLIHLGLLCSLNDPQSRPTMKWVVEALSGNIIGELPPLPSFHSHPFYVSLPSFNTSTTSITTTRTTTTSNITSSTTTDNSISSTYATASGDTMFVTADNSSSSDNADNSKSNCRITFTSVNTPQEISYQEIIAATNNFSESRKVAEVDFGTAYHGYLKNHQNILVKRLGMKTCPALRGRFSDELRNLKRLRHRNLVQLRGWCTEQGEMLVVYDYAVCFLLSHCLFYHHRKKEQPILRWHHRYNIIKSLASAILYLHEEWDEQVIHRNITSSAILLGPDMNPRLGSFALAQFLTRNEHGDHIVINKNSSVRGIFGYMSPEYMESGDATPMADIYSFGVVVLEVVSGRMAVDFQRPEVLLVKKVREFETRKRPLVELADLRLNEDYDHIELERLVNLGMACTRLDPHLRPTMRQIVSALDGNDMWLKEAPPKKEKREEWQRRNACYLSLIRRIQALGLQ